MRIFLTILFSIIFVFNLNAAEITSTNDNGVQIIEINGEIKPGDFSIFRSAYLGSKALVVVSGPGGSAIDSLSIGELIARNKLMTLVEENKECYSGCAIIWISGASRSMGMNSKVGFHGAFRVENESIGAASGVNALIGIHFAKLGFSDPNLIFFLTDKGPDEFNHLTFDIAKKFNIPVQFIDSDFNIIARTGISPEEVKINVNKLTALNYMKRSYCKSLLSISDRRIDEISNDIESKYGSYITETLIKNSNSFISNAFNKIISENGRFGCAIIAEQIIDSGITDIVDGPIFNCSIAKHPTEIAICKSEKLAFLDRISAFIFLALKAKYHNDPAWVKQITKNRLDFINTRNKKCLGNVECITIEFVKNIKSFDSFDLNKH